MNNYSPIFAVSSSGDMKKPFSKPLGDPSTTGEPSGFFVMSEKQCTGCKKDLPITEFGLLAKAPYIRAACNGCRSEDTRLLQRSLKGCIGKMYSHQKQSSKRRGHQEPLYSLRELEVFLLNSEEYIKLHAQWADSGYMKGLKPSCDRLDDYKPYSFDNIRVVTWDENNRKYQSDRVVGVNNKQNMAVVSLDSNNIFVTEYFSIRQAARMINVPAANIQRCCVVKHRRAKGFFWRYKSDYIGLNEIGI